MSIHLLVLNYNGRQLLEECLPSVIRAAEGSRQQCRVFVIDNGSTDGSAAFLRWRFPQVGLIRQSNRGLCSFNEVLAELDGPLAILLNNDIKLAADAVDPLVAPLLDPDPQEPPCFMTVPLCWRFDGQTYEGFRTSVQWRWGLVQATALFSGHESTIHEPGLTASAGAAIAVDRRKFLELGGFDPLFLPGRIEDLDFALRGYLAGYVARYVPSSVAYHRGMSTFREVYGLDGCDRLALRNTLLLQWKNLRRPLHVARQWTGLPVRIARDLFQAPRMPPARRLPFIRALGEAWTRWHRMRGRAVRPPQRVRHAERWFFRRFHPSRMVSQTADPAPGGDKPPEISKREVVTDGLGGAR